MYAINFYLRLPFKVFIQWKPFLYKVAGFPKFMKDKLHSLTSRAFNLVFFKGITVQAITKLQITKLQIL